MTVILEEDAITEWLVGYLEADATLAGMVEGDVAPEVVWGTNRSPFVRIDRLDGDDLMVVGLHRIWADTTYHVRGVYHLARLRPPGQDGGQRDRRPHRRAPARPRGRDGGRSHPLVPD